MRIYQNLGELIGHTPLLALERLAAQEGCAANLWAKLEYYNPAGSVKDRIGWAILEDAEQRGLLRTGSVIIEPTSGNTGIGIAMAARVKGYRVILTMPETMSAERRTLLASYGAELVLTEGKLGMGGAVAKAEALCAELDGSFMPCQFDNPVNALTHEKTTAQEIWQDTDGRVDVLIACIGTGGTITGTSRGLKAHNPAIYCVGVEPARSPLLTEGTAGPHGIQGIGANFIPAVLQREAFDEVLAVSDEAAFALAGRLAQTEGILCGISAGAALAAALQIAERAEFAGKNIVVILPDGGDRYLSLNLYQ